MSIHHCFQGSLQVFHGNRRNGSGYLSFALCYLTCVNHNLSISPACHRKPSNQSPKKRNMRRISVVSPPVYFSLLLPVHITPHLPQRNHNYRVTDPSAPSMWTFLTSVLQGRSKAAGFTASVCGWCGSSSGTRAQRRATRVGGTPAPIRQAKYPRADPRAPSGCTASRP